MLHLRAQLIIAFVVALSAPAPQCQAQTGSYPNYGFRSYSNSGQRSYSSGNYNSGLGGRATNNSFDTGFSGVSQSSNPFGQPRAVGAQQNSRSTQAMNDLTRTLNAIDNPAAWSRTPVSMSPIQQMRAQPTGMMPARSPRQEMLRVFLEAGTPQMGGASAPGPSYGSSGNSSTAYSNYKTAENEASKARNQANRARYDKDSWNRKNDASQAQYAANNADYAAQRAEAAAYSGDSQARGYANMARQAANRARQSADQARYDADTMR